jgi:hypothetical protein
MELSGEIARMELKSCPKTDYLMMMMMDGDDGMYIYIYIYMYMYIYKQLLLIFVIFTPLFENTSLSYMKT